MKLKKFVREIEVILHKVQIIQMKLFVQYHNDHQRKDLKKQHNYFTPIKKNLLLYIFALIDPRCP
jgi:hypothetical protein